MVSNHPKYAVFTHHSPLTTHHSQTETSYFAQHSTSYSSDTHKIFSITQPIK